MKSISLRDVRADSHTLTQHVGLKGHNGMDIFREDDDREKFMKSINAACEKYEVDLLVYVLMSNHVHLILKGEIKQFKFVFESLGASYARWFNRKYGNKGAFWDQRYYNLPINSRRQFLNCAAYIFNNPVKAGMVKRPQEYEWSNFEALRKDFEDPRVSAAIDELVGVANLIKTTIVRCGQDMLVRQERNLELMREYRICDSEVASKVKSLDFNTENGKGETTKQKREEIVKKLWRFGANIIQIANATRISRKFVAETVEFL